MTPLLHDAPYHAPSTYAFNNDIAKMKIAPDEALDFEAQPQEVMPQALKIDVIFSPKFLHHSQTTAQLIIDQKPLEPLFLYQKEALPQSVQAFCEKAVSHIDIFLSKKGQFDLNDATHPLDALQTHGFVMPKTEKPLLQHTFCFEQHPVIEHLSTHTNKRHPPETKGHIVRPYAGLFQTDLKACCQVYYEITEAYPAKTNITLLENINPFTFDAPPSPQDAVVFSIPKEQLSAQSLGHALQNGDLKLNLRETASGEHITYHSTRYQHKQDTVFTVTFTPLHPETLS
ncbi:MAG: hypothetical protein ACPG7U_04505 [Holosporaceae bacterium]